MLVILLCDDEFLAKTSVVTYLGIYIDDKLYWKHHVGHVYKLCCQRIGVFKKVLPCLPPFASVLYYNAFIKSCFSYCILLWFNNSRSGRCKLIVKIEHLIAFLAKHNRLNVHDFTHNFHVYDVLKAYNMQCLSFMHDLVSNSLSLPGFPLTTNSMVHAHNSRVSSNIHIPHVSSLDNRNFIYHSVKVWNASPVEYRDKSKNVFLMRCKLDMFGID